MAGLYEGEGSLVRRVDKRNGIVSWELSIACTDADVISRAHEVTQVGRIYLVPRQRPNWQDKYRWHVGSRDDIAFVAGLVMPYLGERRRERVYEFLCWYRSTNPNNTPVGRGYLDGRPDSG